MKFVQLIEFRTSRLDEFNALVDEWMEQSKGFRTAVRGMEGRDRDRDDTYIQIVEFPSYEKAMENSNRPETAEFAERLAKLCDGPPTFRNLDVVREDEM